MNSPPIVVTVNFARISWVGGLLWLALCGACQPPAVPAPQHAKATPTQEGAPPQHAKATPTQEGAPSQHAEASQTGEVPQPAPPRDKAGRTPHHSAVANVSAEHAPPWAKDDVADATTPWQLQLSEELVATLINRSTSTQWALHDARLQPSELIVASEGGKRWPITDERAIEKFDNTVYAESFQQVAPGATLPLFTLDDKTTAEGSRLEWGPFRVESLPPGRYWLRIEWQTQVQTYFDPKKKRTRALAGVWQGKLSSPWRQITLPR